CSLRLIVSLQWRSAMLACYSMGTYLACHHNHLLAENLLSGGCHCFPEESVFCRGGDPQLASVGGEEFHRAADKRSFSNFRLHLSTRLPLRRFGLRLDGLARRRVVDFQSHRNRLSDAFSQFPFQRGPVLGGIAK